MNDSSSPFVADKTLYVGSGNGTLYALTNLPILKNPTSYSPLTEVASIAILILVGMIVITILFVLPKKNKTKNSGDEIRNL